MSSKKHPAQLRRGRVRVEVAWPPAVGPGRWSSDLGSATEQSHRTLGMLLQSSVPPFARP